MTNEKTATRRKRRIAARRAQILEAAATVFKTKGYGRATTKEIADAADVSEGTLYNYFNSKRELLIGLFHDFASETVEAIANIQAEGVEDMITQVMAGRFQSMRKKRMFTLILHEARMDPEIHYRYIEEVLSRVIGETEQRIQALITAGIMRPVNAAIVARTLVGAMMGFAVMFDMEHDVIIEEMPPEALANEVMDIFLHGLYAQPGEEKGGAS